MNAQKTILVTGGAGYVGAVLVPKLLNEGYHVRVLDLCLYGEDVLDEVAEHPNFQLIRGDIRDQDTVDQAMDAVWAVIHLACISNDPSFELNPELGKSINLDAFEPLVDSAIDHGVERFIYASSSSVYGVKDEPNVTEELSLEPLTDYSKFKAECEKILESKRRPGFHTLTIRPATVCGYSPRLRLDVTVNILTNHAVNKRAITVFGGKQLRPNIHIEDMCALYVHVLRLPAEQIDGKCYNAGYQNHPVGEIAELVRSVVGDDVTTEYTESNDTRSYHISSEKLRDELGFAPSHSIEDAVKDLVMAFHADKIPDSLSDSRYYNIRRMQEVKLS